MSLRASLSPAVRWPSTDSVSELLFDALGQEILAEKASALGRAGGGPKNAWRNCADARMTIDLAPGF